MTDQITVVIFGASGDLTRRKLVPALFNSFIKGRLPDKFQIVGTSRSPYAHDEFRELMLQGMRELAQMDPEPEDWGQFKERLWYFPGDVKQPSDYESLDRSLAEIEDGDSHRLYYLATAPSFFPVVVRHLGEQAMAAEDNGWRRLIIEKPFGRDLASAHELNEVVHAAFHEHQIYRIDHYLGKETAQNILYFRFLNAIFEPLWNRNYIDHVQITVAEQVDVGHRADYYDTAGVVRDMFQNHLLQLLALVAMEPPATMEADAVRNDKVKVLKSLRPIALEDTVRAQYDGYCSTEGVAESSQTPTYAAMKVFIDNWRWKEVPFYLRSGKALPTKTSEILIQFNSPPHLLFALPADYQLTPNFLSLCVQPDEGIHLRFETKVPDSMRQSRSVDMEFHYSDYFGDDPLPDAYERLLLDALNGDPSLFTRSDEIEAAWEFVDPLLQGLERSADAPRVVEYDTGSWGPAEADELLARDGRAWRLGCGHD